MKVELNTMNYLNTIVSSKNKARKRALRLTVLSASTLTALIGLQFPSTAMAANLKLAWNASSDSRTAGYQIAYGLASGRYTTQLDVGNQTQFNVTGLANDTAYYFVVSGYTSDKGAWSGYSNEAVARTAQAQLAPAAPVASQDGTLQYSPTYGSTGGTPFTDQPSTTQKLTGVQMRVGWTLDAIQAMTSSGALASHGGSGGDAASFNLPAGEYLVGMSGRYAATVSELSFTTNTGKKFGPYGAGLDPDGTPANATFNITVESGKEIVGFTGRAGAFLRAIGAVVRTRQASGTTTAQAPAAAPKVESSTTPPPASTQSAVSNASGGNGGQAFTDALGANQHLVGVQLRSGWALDGIQGLSTAGPLAAHGGNGGDATNITLEPGEYFVRIWGRHANYVSELSLQTNTGRVFGPYGEGRDPDGTAAWGDFRYSVSRGNEIIGFTGRSGTFVDAIGIVERAR